MSLQTQTAFVKTNERVDDIIVILMSLKNEINDIKKELKTHINDNYGHKI